MYRANRGLLGVGLAMLLVVVVPCAFGQGSVGISMSDGGPYTMNGVYVGQYDATVNGTPAQIICDDFSHDTYLNESWTANVTNFSNLGSSTTPMWSGKSNALTLYADAAWLATQMTMSANKNNSTEGYLAYALWSLFNPSALNGLSSSQLKGVNYWLGMIPGGLTPSQYANFFIYTPDLTKPITCGGGTCPTAPPQEFLGFSVPEGGAPMLYLLLAAFACFGAIALRHRRHEYVS
ncbi:MAG: hypothetical protein WB952_11870 [Terriglobales bacterium]